MSELKYAVEHLAIAAKAPVALRDWYVTILNAFEKLRLNDSPPAFMIQLPGGLLVEIYQAESSLPDTSRNSLAGLRHLALRVENLEAARDALIQAGVKFDDPVKSAGGGGRVLFFRDLEGNLLHLVERPPEAILRLT